MYLENLSLTAVSRHARINGRLGDLRGNPCIHPLMSTMQKRKKRKLSSLAGSTYSTPQKQVNMSLCWSNVRLAVAIFNAKGNHSVDKNEKRNRNLFKIERRAQSRVLSPKPQYNFAPDKMAKTCKLESDTESFPSFIYVNKFFKVC